MDHITVKTPGKLILAGEWSVLEPNHSCVVLAINKYVTVTITHSNTITVTTKDSNIKKEKLRFAQYAVEITLQYLAAQHIPITPCAIIIDSEISKIKLKDGSYSKIGLGSSSATVVGIVSAILKFHKRDIDTLKTKKIIFKLSAIAHYIGQGNVGSCADIAACTYKQPVIYKRFDTDWFEKNITQYKTTEVINQKWPGLQITPIRLPKELILCAGFVGYGASTKELIPKVLKLKKNNATEYNRTLFSINNVVEHLILQLQSQSSQTNQEQILRLIKKNKTLLKQLYPQLETYELNKLISVANKLGAAAKFSGAGGGDCGIAICFDKNIAEKIKTEWSENNIYPLDIEVLNTK